MENYVVNIGGLNIGHGFPIRIQTMTNTPTEDVKATLAQTIRCIEAGAELVRITTPTLKDVEALQEIHRLLRMEGFSAPLVADVHFNPRVAEAAARVVEKVRINPGNYIDKKNFDQPDYSDAAYALELEKIHERMSPLLSVCRQYGTAIRIGVNHGSLGDRIMNRFGDTPEGMVESAMEFLRICRAESFHQLVISMKASNTRIMIYATRMLHERMIKEGFLYPLHLGVTEAGEGEDGRIKSAAGIGTLLLEGIGDTIRVSLTEDPERELPVAKNLASLSLRNRTVVNDEETKVQVKVNAPPAFSFSRRPSLQLAIAGGSIRPVLISELQEHAGKEPKPDILYLRRPDPMHEPDAAQVYLFDEEAWTDLYQDHPNVFPLVEAEYFAHWRKTHSGTACMLAEPRHLHPAFLDYLVEEKNCVLFLQSFTSDPTGDIRNSIAELDARGIRLPVIPVFNFSEDEAESLQINAAALAGPLLIDGLADGYWLRNAGEIPAEQVNSTAMGIMQACRLRTFRTEYIACPSCGRTLFNITEVLQKIRERTNHLTHLKIGVMGCIVNGPGEMADADYGYVGAGPGKVNLYKGREVVRKNIPQEKAVEELVSLIKEMGDWKEIQEI
ncbi:MAG: (E)-4-hydroxy-3-methylbut-2-enyl-diphosphate synthase [Bacteroidales bacterium]